MLQIDVGDNSTAAPDILPVNVSPGQTVNVLNLSGSTLNYFAQGIDGPVSTLTVGNTAAFTAPGWIQSQGITTVQITGGQYG